MKPRTGVYVYVSYSEQQEKKRSTIEHNKNAQKNSKQETNQFHFQKKVSINKRENHKSQKGKLLKKHQAIERNEKQDGKKAAYLFFFFLF